MLVPVKPALLTAGRQSDQAGYFQVGVVVLHIGCVVVRVDVALLPRRCMRAEEGINYRVTEVVQSFRPENGAMCEVMGKIERQQQGRVPVQHVTNHEKRRTRGRVQA